MYISFLPLANELFAGFLHLGISIACHTVDSQYNFVETEESNSQNSFVKNLENISLNKKFTNCALLQDKSVKNLFNSKHLTFYRYNKNRRNYCFLQINPKTMKQSFFLDLESKH